MNFLKNYESNYPIIFSFLISLLPVSFIAGNLVINLNIILIITLSLIFFLSDLFKIKYFLIDKIIISYFLIIVTGIYNDYNLYKVYNEFSSFRGSYATSLKSFLF